MPELPDIIVFAFNLKQQYAGSLLSRVEVVNGKKFPGNPNELAPALEGKRLLDVFRSGKEFRFVFEGEVIMGMHLMLTGDIFLF
jgi:formamidopyrimidine-DNA glycosylase